ncbi:MAG: hypothetical protein JKY65_16040 [Planctomycetes bacterium]|nr:hypothetical protein [Planctomycetota bacterium]
MHFGTRRYGKVDQIPGLCHLTTEFFAVNWFPLIPLRTVAVLEKGDDELEEAGLPKLLWKSVFVAWARALLVVVATMGGLLGLIGLFAASGFEPGGTIGGVACVFAVAGLLASYSPFIRKANYQQACRVAAAIGLDGDTQVRINIEYGRIDPEDGAALLEDSARERAAASAGPLANRQASAPARSPAEARQFGICPRCEVERKRNFEDACLICGALIPAPKSLS